jgi:hypothetical protein
LPPQQALVSIHSGCKVPCTTDLTIWSQVPKGRDTCSSTFMIHQMTH